MRRQTIYLESTNTRQGQGSTAQGMQRETCDRAREEQHPPWCRRVFQLVLQPRPERHPQRRVRPDICFTNRRRAAMDAQIGSIPESIKDDGRQHLHICTTDSQAECKDKRRLRVSPISGLRCSLRIACECCSDTRPNPSGGFFGMRPLPCSHILFN